MVLSECRAMLLLRGIHTRGIWKETSVHCLLLAMTETKNRLLWWTQVSLNASITLALPQRYYSRVWWSDGAHPKNCSIYVWQNNGPIHQIVHLISKQEKGYYTPRIKWDIFSHQRANLNGVVNQRWCPSRNVLQKCSWNFAWMGNKIPWIFIRKISYMYKYTQRGSVGLCMDYFIITVKSPT